MSRSFALVSSISPLTTTLLLKNLLAKFFCTSKATTLALKSVILEVTEGSANPATLTIGFRRLKFVVGENFFAWEMCCNKPLRIASITKNTQPNRKQQQHQTPNNNHNKNTFVDLFNK